MKLSIRNDLIRIAIYFNVCEYSVPSLELKLAFFKGPFQPVSKLDKLPSLFAY